MSYFICGLVDYFILPYGILISVGHNEPAAETVSPAGRQHIKGILHLSLIHI